MTAGQRRAFWLCIFAMTFIFWYEASGHSLVRSENIPEKLVGTAARHHFWSQISYGAMFLVMGIVLTILLRSRERHSPYQLLDWVSVTVGLGVLFGIAYRSYATVMGQG